MNPLLPPPPSSILTSFSQSGTATTARRRPMSPKNSELSSSRKIPSIFIQRRPSGDNHNNSTPPSSSSLSVSAPTRSPHIHRPLHQSSPTLFGTAPRQLPHAPCVATSRSNPTMSSTGSSHGSTGGTSHGSSSSSSSGRNGLFRGLKPRISGGVFHPSPPHFQKNASFQSTRTSSSNITSSCFPQQQQQQQQQHALQRSATAKLGSRTNLVALDKIIQRSSSKKVKEMLSDLEDLCGCDDDNHNNHNHNHNNHHKEATEGATPPPTAPWNEIEMLLELSTDVYYRVVMKKCRGVHIFTKLMDTFPELEEPCQELIAALGTASSSAPPPGATSFDNNSHHRHDGSSPSSGSGSGDDNSHTILSASSVSPRSTRCSNMLLVAEPSSASSSSLLQQDSHRGRVRLPKAVPPSCCMMVVDDAGSTDLPMGSCSSPSSSTIDHLLRMRVGSAIPAPDVLLRKGREGQQESSSGDDTDEDIRQIIHDGCQELLWRRQPRNDNS